MQRCRPLRPLKQLFTAAKVRKNLQVSKDLSIFEPRTREQKQIKTYIQRWKELFSPTTAEETTSMVSVREWPPQTVAAYWLHAAPKAARSWPFLTSVTANKPQGHDKPTQGRTSIHRCPAFLFTLFRGNKAGVSALFRTFTHYYIIPCPQWRKRKST